MASRYFFGMSSGGKIFGISALTSSIAEGTGKGAAACEPRLKKERKKNVLLIYHIPIISITLMNYSAIIKWYTN